MKKSVLLIILLALAFVNCSQEKSKEYLIWEKKFIKTQFAVLSTNPLIHDKYLILCRDIYNNNIPETKILAYDKLSGEELWEWQEVKHIGDNGVETYFAFTQMFAHDGILIGVDQTEIVGIDLSSGQKLWRLSYFENPEISRIFEDGIFYIVLHDYLPWSTGVSVIEVDAYTGNTNRKLDKFLLYEGQGALHTGFYPYLNNEGEKCIVFGVGHFTYPYDPGAQTELGLVNYNLDKSEEIFYRVLETNSGVSQLFAYGDNLYGSGFFRTKFDGNTGETLYEIEQDVRTKTNRLTLYDYPHLYIMYNTQAPSLVKCDLESGEEIWRGSFDGHQSRTFHKYESSIFLMGGNGKIYQLNDSTGNLERRIDLLIDEDDPEGSHIFFDEYYNLDPETGYAYVIDNEYLYCINLNEK